MLSAPLVTQAQTGLHIDQLFQGNIIPQERMVETRVRGKSLERYQLSYYRSLRMTITLDESQQLLLLLDKDIANSIDMRTYRKNPHSWKTYTCKLQMPAANGKNRFLCYQEQWNRAHNQCELTVIYMEGRVFGLQSLEQLLK